MDNSELIKRMDEEIDCAKASVQRLLLLDAGKYQTAVNNILYELDEWARNTEKWVLRLKTKSPQGNNEKGKS